MAKREKRVLRYCDPNSPKCQFRSRLTAAEADRGVLDEAVDALIKERDLLFDQLVAAEEKIERLEKQHLIATCPCGGWLEGVGINIAKQENVYQCDKCGIQLIIPRQAPQEPYDDRDRGDGG